jgi:hypothetical protein
MPQGHTRLPQRGVCGLQHSRACKAYGARQGDIAARKYVPYACACALLTYGRFFFEIHRPKFRLLTCRSCMIFMNGLEDNGGYFDICFLAILKLKRVS